MFIITLGDVFGLVILGGVIIYIAFLFCAGLFYEHIGDKNTTKKPETPKEPVKKADPKPEVITDKKTRWLVTIILIMFAIAIGAALLAIKK